MTEEEIRAARVDGSEPGSGPIVLVDYDPAWPTLFDRESRAHPRSARRTGGRAPALRLYERARPAAKPIIDIVLGVPDSADEPAFVPALEAVGYRLHVREPGWFEHRLFKGPDTDVNLHVFSAGSPEIKRMLTLRARVRSK